METHKKNTIKPLLNILWKTKEGIACKRAIKYFNNHFDEWDKKNIQEKLEIFEQKFDKPLNNKFQQLLKQYEVKK